MTATETASALLETMEVSAEFQHIPTTYDPQSKEWQHIAWKVTIMTPRGTFTTDYKQGIGHLPKSWGLDPLRGVLTVDKLAQIRHVLAHGCRGRDIGGDIRGRAEELPRPSLVDVLHCIFSDAQSGENDFPDFCAELGYDEDSRKAEATWRACRDTGAALHRLFTGEQFDRLAEVLADV